MLQGHVFHSFTRPEERAGGLYVISQFLGGMPPAVFLFLLGVTLSFLMHSRARKGDPAGRRVFAGIRRAGFLLAVAFAFRLQLWLFGWPGSATSDLLKVDILNCMGFTVAVMSIMAVFTTQERVRLCAALGVAIAVASPLVSLADWSGAPAIVKAYLAPNYSGFSFFPWAAFVPFGMSAGSIMRLLDAERMERAAQWSALLGLSLIAGGLYFSSFPYSLYPKTEFWLNSPWLIVIKLGVILLTLSFAYLWTTHSQTTWSWVRQFGMTSLLVYWVHIELIYGRWLWFWKENLPAIHAAIAAAVVIVFMLILSTARIQWKNWRLLSFSLGWYFFGRRESQV